MLSKQRGHRDMIRGGEDVSHLTKTTTPIQSGSLSIFFLKKKKKLAQLSVRFTAIFTRKISS